MGVQFSTAIEDLESGLRLMMGIEEPDKRFNNISADRHEPPVGPRYRSILAFNRANA